LPPPAPSGAGRGRAPAASVQPMPPGWVIGGPPGVGVGHPAPRERAVQPVNPVGGGIQPAGPMSRPNTDARNPTTSTMPLTSAGSRIASKDDENAKTRHWDLDNPW